MALTITEKIVRNASGRSDCRPGKIVTCRVDLALLLDSGGPRRIWPRLKELGVGVWDPDRIVLCTDHFVPAVDTASAAILKLTREFAAEFGINKFFDMQGIGHLMLAEQGFLQPGMFACGGDSHSTHGGAFGCYISGFGAIEMTGVTVTGEIWVPVPETVRINWEGEFQHGVVAKDIMLKLCRELGMNNGGVVMEYGGSTVRAMDMQERAVLCNMAAELGAETGIVEPDEVTLQALRDAGQQPAADALEWRSDPGAVYKTRLDFSSAELEPQIAAPHAPSNSGPVGDYHGTKINQAYVGSCVGAKLSDLHMVAEVLRGRKVKPGTRLMVAPASARVMTAAAVDGTLAVITQAGGIMLPTGCGACAALGAGILAENEVCVSTTNRNFKGRMGANSASVYLASPYSVAAAAVAGELVDPREMLGKAP
ncbi:aconitase/3-isopropylmalate dehydratase large subunit family protein [Gammaproteobacteria bacterium]|nr:aconitase/3-isopropylmalate dehydratase large subunit family protein [Gammaproteobacteria bacterium]